MMDSRQFLRVIEPILKPIKNRIMMAIARGIIESVKDDGGVQSLKVSLLKDEVRDSLERIQQFGFTSNPPSGSEAVALFVGGNREHGFVVACDHRPSRKRNLQPGECAIYTDDGTYLILKKGGQVEIKSATKLTIDVPNSEFKGDIKVTGKVEVTGNISTDANLTVGGNATVTGAVSAASVAASGGVSGSGTSLAAIKSGFNSHTHAGGSVPPPDVPIP